MMTSVIERLPAKPLRIATTIKLLLITRTFRIIAFIGMGTINVEPGDLR